MGNTYHSIIIGFEAQISIMACLLGTNHFKRVGCDVVKDDEGFLQCSSMYFLACANDALPIRDPIFRCTYLK